MEGSAPTAKDAVRRRYERAAEVGRALHDRYSRLFWTLHSTWALVSGGIVLVLAHNRYGFLPWVVLFLGLTWLTTLFFSRLAVPDSARVRAARGFVSYITRVMYQETLFFLLPFYFYSTTFVSWNSAYVVVLAGLAVLSCFDVVFDRLLRTNRWFALTFFAFVTFSALQFFLPLLLHVPIHNGAYLAAGLSFLASLPLAYAPNELNQPRRVVLIFAALVVVMGTLKIGRELIPPVPLRLTDLAFGIGIDPRTHELEHPLRADRPPTAAEMEGGRLYARATIFSPGTLPVRARIRFLRDGAVLKTSRNLDLVAHQKGFHVWDGIRIPAEDRVAGVYSAEVWTSEGQLVGRGRIRIAPAAADPTR